MNSGFFKDLIVWQKAMELVKAVYALADSGKILSASVVKEGGAAASVCKACFGNGLGFKFAKELTNKELFAPLSGSLVIELADGAESPCIRFFGYFGRLNRVGGQHFCEEI